MQMLDHSANRFHEHKLIDLTDRIDRDTAVYYGGGRFGDVYKCRYTVPSDSSPSTVAVKSVRCFVSSGEESEAINKDLRRELGLWRRLDFDHQNIVPLLGVTKWHGPLDAIVSAWMPNGTLHSFLKVAGETHTLVQRFSILYGIASCLEYLHSIPVLHGDLTSCNILIDEECKPRLTDFGLSSALGKLQPGMTYLNRCSTDPGAIRWAAPELFYEECEPKPSVDVYSFGCIMLEVLSGNIPWEGKPERVVMRLKILERKFPDRPTAELDDKHWELMTMCWLLPEKRPSAQQVVRHLADLQSVDPRGNRRVQEAIHSTEGTWTGRKRALLIAIRHVARGFAGRLPDSHLAHRDACALRDHLIDSYGYHADDVVLMMDDKHLPKHLWPTHNRILHQIDRLVNDAPDDGHFFFYFTGCCLEFQEENKPGIITADGKAISSHVLHERLVAPLSEASGSRLFALFDCGHSETLLDLQANQWPNTYSREWRVGPGHYFKVVVICVVRLLQLSKKHCRQVDLPSTPQQKDAIQGVVLSSEPVPATKMKSDTQEFSVISLSACKDAQDAHDVCERGLTFTKFVVDTLRARPNITFVELRDQLKALVSEIRERYDETYLNMPTKDYDMDFERWTQEPRYSTTPCTDLTKLVEF